MFTAGTGPFVLEFDVTVNPLVPAGTVIPNRGGYESDETPYFLSNEVEPVVVGPSLEFFKTGPALLHPNEVATFEITVANVGADAANNLMIRDPFPVNTSYVAGSMEWRLNTQPYAALTDAADADEGTAFADRVELVLTSLGPGQDVTFRFRVQVDPGTAGLFVNNQAAVSSSELASTDTNLVQAPIVGGSDVTGHVFLDLDGNGTQEAGEPDLANVDVVVTDSARRDPGRHHRRQRGLARVGGPGMLQRPGRGHRVRGLRRVGRTGAPPRGSRPRTTAARRPATSRPSSNPSACSGNSLWLTGDPASNTRALSRQADPTGLTGATLSFNYRRVSHARPTDSVAVEVSYDGGGSFANLGDPGRAPRRTAPG